MLRIVSGNRKLACEIVKDKEELTKWLFEDNQIGCIVSKFEPSRTRLTMIHKLINTEITLIDNNSD